MKKILSILSVLTMSVSIYANDLSLSLSGNIISDNEKMITSRNMGFVTSVLAKEGEHVKKGDILYKIDTKEVDYSLKQINLAISQAELAEQMQQDNLDNVELNLKRKEKLFKKDIIAKYELENIELAHKKAVKAVVIYKAKIDLIKEQKKEILNQYQYLNVKAPNDGVIIAKNVKVGEMAMPGMPAFVLTDLNNLKVSLEISESNIKYITLNKIVDIDIDSLNLKLKGKIIALIPSFNKITHNFKVKIQILGKHSQLYPGMNTVVHIPISTKNK